MLFHDRFGFSIFKNWKSMSNLKFLLALLTIGLEAMKKRINVWNPFQGTQPEIQILNVL